MAMLVSSSMHAKKKKNTLHVLHLTKVVSLIPYVRLNV